VTSDIVGAKQTGYSVKIARIIISITMQTDRRLIYMINLI